MYKHIEIKVKKVGNVFSFIGLRKLIPAIPIKMLRENVNRSS